MTEPAVKLSRNETLEYLRRAYATTREWYTVAERKAQLALGANGILVTAILGSIFGRVDQLHALRAILRPDTWALLTLAALLVVGAVSCAGLAMWSLHGKASLQELEDIRIRNKESDTYRPEALWYFGHLAVLDFDQVRKQLEQADYDFEIQVLSYHLVSLARRVYRKHKFVNGAWALTSLAVVLITLGALSIIAQA